MVVDSARGCGAAAEGRQARPGAEFTVNTRRLGIGAASLVAALILAYAVALAVGLSALESPEEPIGGSVFVALEVLILALVPAIVALMVAVHAWAPAPAKALSLAALVFMALTAGVTGAVHFVVLTLGRHPEFASQPWTPWLLSFRWPSVVYALDILAWDVFFALSMFCAAPVFGGSRLALWIRRSMLASGALAFLGLAGVAAGDMRIRNVGILGYVVGFLAVAILLAVLFVRTAPADGPGRA
jgi:hypothetical protein